MRRRSRRSFDRLLLAIVVVTTLVGTSALVLWATVRGDRRIGGWVALTSRASVDLHAGPGHLHFEWKYTTWPVHHDRRFAPSRPPFRMPDGFVETGFLNGQSAALGVTVHRQEYQFQSQTGGARYALGSRYVGVPYWLLAGVTLPVAVVATMWRRHRRRGPRAGMCPGCGYDLRATPDRCPECGAAVPQPPYS
jgi:hypothetical protein